MAALDFPDTPTNGQVYDKWTWNGTQWVLTVGTTGLRVAGEFTFPNGVANDIPWSNTGDLKPALTATGTPTSNLSLSSGQVLIGKRMRVTIGLGAQINTPAGYDHWGRTALSLNGALVGLIDVRRMGNPASSLSRAYLTSIPSQLNPGDLLSVALAQGGQSAQSAGGTLSIYGQEEA